MQKKGISSHILPHAAGRQRLAEAFQAGWIVIQPVPLNAPPPVLGLDAGEQAAIQLALSLSSSRLLIDEREGGQAAKHARLRVTGVLGLLLVAKQRGLLPSVSSEIPRLRHEARFFIDKVLERETLPQAGE